MPRVGFAESPVPTSRVCNNSWAAYFAYIPIERHGVSNSSDQRWRFNRCVDLFGSDSRAITISATLLSWSCGGGGFTGSELSFSRWLFAFSLVTTLFFTCEYRRQPFFFFQIFAS